MKVTIKLNNEQSFTVTIPDNSTVEDLKIASLVALPNTPNLINYNKQSTKLWYSGKKMEFSSLLSSYGISSISNSTIYLTLTDDSSSALLDDNELLDSTNDSNLIEQPKTIAQKRRKSSKKSKSNKCYFASCNSVQLRMVGDCSYCNGKFCSKHRLLESHDCKGLQSCKDKSYERNALKLQSEQTVASKV